MGGEATADVVCRTLNKTGPAAVVVRRHDPPDDDFGCRVEVKC